MHICLAKNIKSLVASGSDIGKGLNKERASFKFGSEGRGFLESGVLRERRLERALTECHT